MRSVILLESARKSDRQWQNRAMRASSLAKRTASFCPCEALSEISRATIVAGIGSVHRRIGVALCASVTMAILPGNPQLGGHIIGSASGSSLSLK